MSVRVFVYVQHLLGIGHLKRAALLAEAMADAGLLVRVVLGGPAVPGIGFAGCARTELPPVRAADGTFATLLDADGAPIDDAFREARRERLLDEFAAARPDVLIIEQFPFGRRAFRFELLPLIAAARGAEPRPSLLSSVRDVVVRKLDPARNAEMVRMAATLFDQVLVHGDPALLPLTRSLPEAGAIADRLVYTGYVAAPPHHRPGAVAGRGEVIVSAGGGSVGETLFRTALAARSLSCVASRPWRLLIGLNASDRLFDDLAWSAPPGVIVERWRDDLPTLLANCVLSISQGGYNTVCDLLVARPRAVIVPFAEHAETEQTTRTRALAKCNVVSMVDPAKLTPETLAAAVDEALVADRGVVSVDLSGAATAARLVAEAGQAAARQRRAAGDP